MFVVKNIILKIRDWLLGNQSFFTEQPYFLLNDITLFFYVKKRRKMFLLKNDYAIVVSWIRLIYNIKRA